MRRKAELPLDLDGPHITEGASSQHRLYQALCHAITGGIAKPGEPLPPQRTLAKQTGFRRNAVTSAYERLIADGFAVATIGSGTFVAARIPARVNDARKTRIAIEPPQQGALALGCTHIDERALQRFRSFAGRRMRAFGTEHLQYGDPRGSRELRAAIADHLLSARGLRCDPDQIMLASGTQHALRIVLGAGLFFGGWGGRRGGPWMGGGMGSGSWGAGGGSGGGGSGFGGFGGGSFGGGGAGGSW